MCLVPSSSSSSPSPSSPCLCPRLFLSPSLLTSANLSAWYLACLSVTLSPCLAQPPLPLVAQQRHWEPGQGDMAVHSPGEPRASSLGAGERREQQMGKSGGEGCGREALFQKQNQDFPRIPRTKEAMQVTSQGNSHLLPSSSSASSPGRRGGLERGGMQEFLGLQERCGGVGGIVTNYHNLRGLKHIFTILHTQRSRVQSES